MCMLGEWADLSSLMRIALYSLIDINLLRIIEVIETNVAACLEAKTFKDNSPVPYLRTKVINIVSGVQIFKPITVLFSESVQNLVTQTSAHSNFRYFDRYRSATTTHPELSPFIANLNEKFEEWADLIIGSKFDDALTARDKKTKEYFIGNMRQEFKLLLQAVSRSLPVNVNSSGDLEVQPYMPSLGVLAALERYVRLTTALIITDGLQGIRWSWGVISGRAKAR